MRRKAIVKLYKPIAIGMCILDLSKLWMYDYHYNTIKKQYNDKASLLFTDTDSLTYEIETDDIYKDMAKQKHLYFQIIQKITPFMMNQIKRLLVSSKMNVHHRLLKNL